ncbi:hypothetical protein [Mycobacterium neumannii]|uniref:hypothetical protein n=1 Tax=Mycobacterium neumannii TaxID=2048551 RepID=UPI003AB2CA2D
MRYQLAVPASRIRAALALGMALWLVAVTAQWALPVNEVTPAHGPHTLSSALVSDHPVVVDHQHIDDASPTLPPDALAEAVLPRASTSLILLGLIAALAVIAVCWHQPALVAIRGPPKSRPSVLSGRVLLTRLCIARH